VVEVAAELGRSPPEERPESEPGSRLLLALALLAERKDVAQAKAALAGEAVDPALAAVRLAELAHKLGDGAAAPIDRALGVLLDGGNGERLRGLRAALDQEASQTPPRPGAATVIERLLKRQA
jgi:hypothetical protein